MIIPSLKTKKAAKSRGRYTVTYFPAKISSAYTHVFYHVNAEKDTEICENFQLSISTPIPDLSITVKPLSLTVILSMNRLVSP